MGVCLGAFVFTERCSNRSVSRNASILLFVLDLLSLNLPLFKFIFSNLGKKFILQDTITVLVIYFSAANTCKNGEINVFKREKK